MYKVSILDSTLKYLKVGIFGKFFEKESSLLPIKPRNLETVDLEQVNNSQKISLESRQECQKWYQKGKVQNHCADKCIFG